MERRMVPAALQQECTDRTKRDLLPLPHLEIHPVQRVAVIGRGIALRIQHVSGHDTLLGGGCASGIGPAWGYPRRRDVGRAFSASSASALRRAQS